MDIYTNIHPLCINQPSLHHQFIQTDPKHCVEVKQWFLKCRGKVILSRDLWQLDVAPDHVALDVAVAVVFANTVVEPGTFTTPKQKESI